MSKLRFTEHVDEAPRLRLDLGCGKGRAKKPGFIGVDLHKYDCVDVVADLRDPWPWADNSVDEAFAGHILEYLTGPQRVHFMNDLFRVLKPGAKAEIRCQDWATAKAYGEMAFQWPPISGAWFHRLSKAWWASQDYDDPDGYTCDFLYPPVLGIVPHEALAPYNQSRQQDAVMFHKEAIQELICTLTKPEA